MDGGHAEIIKVYCSVTDKKNNPYQFGKYLKMNKTNFSDLDYGIYESSLWSIVEEYTENMYFRGEFIDIDR